MSATCTLDRVVRPVGHRSGSLTVESRYVDERSGEWCLCRCDCGRTASVRDRRLDGVTRVSCADAECPSRSAGEVVSSGRFDYEYPPGHRVGSLVVRSALDDGSPRFVVVCDCGRELIVYGSVLYHGTDGTTCGRGCPTKLRDKTPPERARVPEIERKRRRVQVLVDVQTYVALLEAATPIGLSEYCRELIERHLREIRQ